MRVTGKRRSLPACRIDDWPEIPLRGHHDDVSRKQISKARDFCELIRELGRYKFNLYTPYIEDVLHLASFPDIGEGRGKLLPDEVRRMVREAQRSNVLLMPTYTLGGHYENILALPRYRHLAREVFQLPSSLDPAKPAVREFLAKVIADVCELFPCPYFHMGFDEMIGLTPDLFIEHANWCAEQLVARGKTPVMWVDMIYNHYGYDAIARLHPSIVAVNWSYGNVGPEGVRHHAELHAQGRELWGLAGYRHTCDFLPDSEGAKDHFEGWMRTVAQHPTPCLASSIWGDNGYENSRHLPWNLYAAFGEATWSGSIERESFERRFQTLFYGRPLAKLERIVRELPRAMSLSPRAIWAAHRRKPEALVRMAAADAGLAEGLDADERLVREALADVAEAKEQATRQADQLDHFTVALQRTLSMIHRLQFACRYVAGMDDKTVRTRVRELVKELGQARRAYRKVWLRHNKPENIEVSLDVFDRVAEDFRSFARPERIPSAARKRFRTLPLPWDTDFLDIGCVPIGETTVNHVPFLFADRTRTHLLLKGLGSELRLRLDPPMPVRDLHLVCALHKPGDEPQPAVRVEWLLDGRAVFSEDLLSIRHLCDWWAILGEHMWAGGGFQYVDPLRVRLALLPDQHYGLTHLSNFGSCGAPLAEEIRLTMLIDGELRLFAATAETAVR